MKLPSLAAGLALLLLLGALPPIFAQPTAKKAAPVKGGVTGGLPPDAKKLNLGDAAPDFDLLGIDGKRHRLADYKAAKLLMEYFATPQGQKVSVTDVGSISPRPDAPTQGVPDLAGRKTFVVGPADMDEYLRSEKPFNDEFARAYTR